ncbi:nickel-dependent lactate racemase [Christensenellaceae bacterium OttesenSCG-928-L17]|nr:nickel-dependent lactate racemase [Christensenellaceae bacterium OttesenSCG-928-L17]
MIQLPYGEGAIPVSCAGARVLTPATHEMAGALAGEELVRQAMQSPIDSPPLCELAAGRNSAVILLSDHTRPVPSRDILPPMLEELRRGNPRIDITLLVATGCHRGTTEAELIKKLGEAVVKTERILVHDCMDSKNQVTLGTLPSGAALTLNRAAVETDLLLAEGFIEPHFFAGFSGGRKAVLPGICARETVLGNHCGKFIDNPHARTGVLVENPLHTDMLAAARMAKLQYIVNVVINEQKKTVAAFEGAAEEAHARGCAYLMQHCRVAAAPADIVVTTNGGAPLDQNIYQCVKGLTAAEASARPGAVLIMCAECADGTGGEDFYRLMADCADVHTLYQTLASTPQRDTVQDQWQAQILARILKKHEVIFVTRPALQKTVADMKMHYAATFEEALKLAKQEQGEAASVTIIPDGVSVMVLP